MNPSKPKSRRQQKRDATIEEILTIARDEMRAHGVAALSLGTIARRMGIKTPSLYHYFSSKDAIYDELFKRGFQQYGRISHQRMASRTILSLRDLFIEGIADYMRFAQENPDLYQIMFQRPVPGFVPSPESYQVSLNLLADFYNFMHELIATSDLKTNLPTNQAVDLLIATMHGLTEMHLANNPEQPVGQGRYGRLIPAAVDVFFAAWSLP